MEHIIEFNMKHNMEHIIEHILEREMKHISKHEMEQNMNLKKIRTYTQTQMEHF